MNMEDKVYVWIDQWYEDIVDVKVFKDKQKALDFVFERRKDEILKFPDPYYTPEERYDLYLKKYEEGNLDYFDIRELELI